MSILQSVKVMEDRINDLKSRSRRDNIRSVGLGETDSRCSSLKHGYRGDKVKIDRALRVASVLTDTQPRPAVIKLLNFGDKQRILQAVREKASNTMVRITHLSHNRTWRNSSLDFANICLLFPSSPQQCLIISL